MGGDVIEEDGEGDPKSVAVRDPKDGTYVQLQVCVRSPETLLLLEVGS
jgi:hypothetical protein